MELQIKETYDLFKNSGFDIAVNGMSFIVSLNRPITVFETRYVTDDAGIECILSDYGDSVRVTF